MEPAKTNLPAILVVDDEMDISLAISDLLRNEGYQVETAGTGTEALDRVSSSHPYSAVILDLGLPDIDGLKVLQQLQIRDHTLPDSYRPWRSKRKNCHPSASCICPSD